MHGEIRLSKLERILEISVILGLFLMFLLVCFSERTDKIAFIGVGSIPLYMIWAYRSPERFLELMFYRYQFLTQKNFKANYKIIRLVAYIRAAFITYWFLTGVFIDTLGVKFTYKQYTGLNTFIILILFMSLFFLSIALEINLLRRVNTKN
jgi:hypothetical protein